MDRSAYVEAQAIRRPRLHRNALAQEVRTAQRSAIEGWFKSFEDVLYSTSWRDPVNGYRRWLDLDSNADVVAELVRRAVEEIDVDP